MAYLNRSHLIFLVCTLLVAVLVLGCGGSNGGGLTPAPQNPITPPPPPPPPPPAPSSPPARVFVIIMENQSYEDMVGSGEMPYLNSLVPQGALTEQFYANTHPSIGNYFMLTTGQVITNDSNFDGVVTENNLVRVMTAANKTWKVYAEGLPSVGYTGGNTGRYVKRHNPFAYLSDVLNDPVQTARMVPYTQFSADLAANNLADFVYLLPDQINNMHDCPVANCTNPDKLRAGDAWLQANVPAILSSPAFHENSVLIFTMDEGEHSDPRNGGGRIVTLFVGPKAKVNFRSTTFYQHENLLRYVLDRFGIEDRPGASATAAAMDEVVR